METKEAAKSFNVSFLLQRQDWHLVVMNLIQERYLELRQLLGHLLADWSDLDGEKN